MIQRLLQLILSLVLTAIVISGLARALSPAPLDPGIALNPNASTQSR